MGLIQTLLLGLGVVATVYALLKKRWEAAITVGAATLLGIALLWMFTSASHPLWNAIDLLRHVQYRTRLMGLASAGCGRERSDSRWRCCRHDGSGSWP